MNEMLMNDGQYVLPVSLGNRAFTATFVRRLYGWVVARGGKKLDVLIGDLLETVNYRIRKGMHYEQALLATRQKALELAKMIQTAANTRGPAVRILIESESRLRESLIFKRISKEAFAAYCLKQQFYREVNQQVQRNLSHTSNFHLIENRIEELAVYVLEELALFAAYFDLNPNVTEVYPGENLEVKAKMMRGEYAAELSDYRPKITPDFIDVSNLVQAENPRQVAA